jgi:4-hydroxy-3-methylbut-2-enyl diphosphate reductase
VRAHGEPPSTYERVNKNSNALSEGTCPIVLQLQKKIHVSWMDYKDKQGQIVIYGKKGHAEVIGLAGQTEGQAILVENLLDLDQIDFTKPVILFAQTTQPPDGYQELVDVLRSKMKPFFLDSVPLHVTNSICGHVSKRGEHLAEFSKNYDVVVFVSGSKSSNGKVLLEICRKNNPNTHWVSGPEDVNFDWFRNADSVGVCGATSTPQWLMESVSHKINNGI